MLIIPAIDLLQGKVVRLYKGKKDSSKVYSPNPLEVALKWKEMGASLIHVVDLDAAFGDGDNLGIIKNIIDIGIDIQVGGGINTVEKASQIIDMGAKRLTVGSGATDDDFLSELLKMFSSKVGVSVDVLEGKFMKSGWQEQTDYQFLDVIYYLIDKGVEWIVYTDISRDGTMEGANLEEVRRLKTIIKGTNFILSGGISSYQDLQNINKDIPFIWGVIVGKALYEGCIDLREAIRSLK